MERFGGQSPKVLASTKGARVVFLWNFTTVTHERCLLTRTWRLPSTHYLMIQRNNCHHGALE
jgi:hypothetical protein